jgi:predicted ATPase
VPFRSCSRRLREIWCRAHLSEDDWDTHYHDLMLQMHTLLVRRMTYCAGDFKGCKKTVAHILTYALSLGGKMPAYFTLTECLCAECQLLEALEVGREFPGKLWQHIPRRPRNRHVLVELLKAKCLLRGKSEEDLFNLNTTKDENVVFAMKLRMGLVGAAWVAVEPEFLALLCTRMARLSLLRGLSNCSAAGFGSYGAVLETTGKHSEVYRYRKLLKGFWNDSKHYAA